VWSSSLPNIEYRQAVTESKPHPGSKHCAWVDQLNTQEGWIACERKKMASRQAIRNVIRDIFGAVPTSATHGKHAARNGMKELQQTQNGVYLKRYFLDSMDAAARKVCCIVAALQRTYADTCFRPRGMSQWWGYAVRPWFSARDIGNAARDVPMILFVSTGGSTFLCFVNQLRIHPSAHRFPPTSHHLCRIPPRPTLALAGNTRGLPDQVHVGDTTTAFG